MKFRPAYIGVWYDGSIILRFFTTTYSIPIEFTILYVTFRRMKPHRMIAILAFSFDINLLIHLILSTQCYDLQISVSQLFIVLHYRFLNILNEVDNTASGFFALRMNYYQLHIESQIMALVYSQKFQTLDFEGWLIWAQIFNAMHWILNCYI